jgi:hypothetical protein
MANILLPSNVSSNVLATPTNDETSTVNRLLIVPQASNPLTEAEKNFILVTSLIISNKTLGSIPVNAKVSNTITGRSAYLLYGVNIPAGTAFEMIQGNKFILKEGDSLSLWHDSTTPNVIDVMMSYTLHVPNSPYTV